MVDLDSVLRRLGLSTVLRLYPDLEQRAEKEEMSYRDYLGVLMAEEVAARTQARIQRIIRQARFPFLRSIEEFDFTFQSSVKLSLFGSYLGPELVSEGRSLILEGPCGTGKTHLAVGIAYRAIQNGFEALFTTASQLIDILSRASHEGRLEQALPAYTRPHVIVIDEVGYISHPQEAANVMFQVVNERYLNKRPMIFTTNKPLDAWGKVLHDADLAEAILDRVLERGRPIHLTGRSYRTRHLDFEMGKLHKDNQDARPSRKSQGQALDLMNIEHKIIGASVEDRALLGSNLSASEAPIRGSNPNINPGGEESVKSQGRGERVPEKCSIISGKTVPKFQEPTASAKSHIVIIVVLPRPVGISQVFLNCLFRNSLNNAACHGNGSLPVIALNLSSNSIT